MESGSPEKPLVLIGVDSHGHKARHEWCSIKINTRISQEDVLTIPVGARVSNVQI
jgi:hypothetical protein